MSDFINEVKRDLEPHETPSELGLKSEALNAAIPKTVQVGNHHISILSNSDKTLIIMYAFIGLAELVSASSGMSEEEIYKGCCKRAIHNLMKDGLLK